MNNYLFFSSLAGASAAGASAAGASVAGASVAALNSSNGFVGSLQAFEGNHGYWLVSTADFEFSHALVDPKEVQEIYLLWCVD